MDGFAGEEESVDVAVGLLGCDGVWILGLVARVFLDWGVWVRLFGLVLALPGYFVGADEHEAVDDDSQLRRDGEKTAEFSGIAFGRWTALVCMACCADDAHFDVDVAIVLRVIATVR